MKLSIILDTLVAAQLPTVTSEQLQHLVGTAQGKAFADDLDRYAAGDNTRREQLAAVVHALAPGVRRMIEKMGFRFDLLMLIAAAKRDGSDWFNTIIAADANPGNRASAAEFLRSAGLQAVNRTEPSGSTPVPVHVRTARTEPPYYSLKIFGSSAALCVSEARTRAGNQCTVQIEGALLLAGGATKEFDWRNKIILQLTVQEAYLLLALFENMIPMVKFDGHGRAHDKSLQAEFQDSHYFVRIIQRGRTAVAVPVRAVDSISVIALLYKQLLRNEPHLRIEDIRGMVQRMATMSAAQAVR